MPNTLNMTGDNYVPLRLGTTRKRNVDVFNADMVFKNFIFVNVCIIVHVCVCMHTGMYVHVCVSTCGG